MSRITPRRVPWGVLGMLALVAAVEAAVARYQLGVAIHFDWARIGRAARREARGCEILCFGDSQVKTGVLPRVIEAGTGRRAYNLAAFAAQAPATYFLLRRALEAGARPAAVVVDFKPYLLAKGPCLAVNPWPDLLEFSESIELAWAGGNTVFFARLTLARLLPTLKDRNPIRSSLLASLRGTPGPLRDGLLSRRRNQRLNRGAEVLARKAEPPPAPNPHDRGLFPRNWRIDPTNALFLDRFMALASSRGIRVYWLLPPYPPGVLGDRERVGAEAAYLAVVRRVQERYPSVTVVDGRGANYGGEVFADPLHLDRRGAAVLSADLAAALLRDAGTSRRIVLPAYRDRPSDAGLEDLDESTMAVKTVSGSVRR